MSHSRDYIRVRKQLILIKNFALVTREALSVQSESAGLRCLRLKWKTVCSSTSSLNGQALRLFQFYLWLMHSFGVDSPDLPRKLGKSKIPRLAGRPDTVTVSKTKSRSKMRVRCSLSGALECIKVGYNET